METIEARHRRTCQNHGVRGFIYAGAESWYGKRGRCKHVFMNSDTQISRNSTCSSVSFFPAAKALSECKIIFTVT